MLTISFVKTRAWMGLVLVVLHIEKEMLKLAFLHSFIYLFWKTRTFFFCVGVLGYNAMKEHVEILCYKTPEEGKEMGSICIFTSSVVLNETRRQEVGKYFHCLFELFQFMFPLELGEWYFFLFSFVSETRE